MEYRLVRAVLNCQHEIAISEAEYSRVRQVRLGLRAALDIEEKAHVLLQNYIDFEEELLKRALDQLAHRDWQAMTDDRLQINVRLINFLNAAKLYLDQVPQDLADLLGEQAAAVSEFKNRTHQEYDGHIEYRAAEALRNYSQHRALPIRLIKHVSKMEDPQDRTSRIKHGITLGIPVARLVDDEKFKPATAQELSEKGEHLFVKPMVRRYLSALFRIHEWVRQEISPTVQELDSHFRELADRWKQETGEATDVGLAAVRLGEHGQWEDHQHVVAEMAARRHRVEKRTPFLGDYARHYISSEIFTEEL